ncbi:MAG: glycoside hydrolase family 3 C-terminal domain-containing protein, partial [Acidimicrobiia bacterium]|nr:glycoside hydrolase family 3 C-terminal domain-containing protein [Acidimicrobiia bacterium]
TVLLRNDGLLPLDASDISRLAVIGAPAVAPCVMGGGSAQVVLRPLTSPLDALREAIGDQVEIVHERGCDIDRSAAVIGGPVLRSPGGFEAELFTGNELDGEVFEQRHLDTLRTMVFGMTAEGPLAGEWSMRVRGTVVPEESGVFELALAQAGRARVLLDGELVLDGFTSPPPPGGSDLFGMASQDLLANVTLTEGTPVDVVVEYSRSDSVIAGFRVGFHTTDADGALERAVAAAAAADVAIVFAGTTGEWETEGRDRDSFQLPGRQDELVRRVAAANPRTAVVVNAAAPVDLAWADDVSAVLQCWFGGEQMAAGVASILTGAADPGGRLPTTIPVHLEHNPSYDNFAGENGELRYGEGLFMGYRGYEHRRIEPRYPFGHGLSYTTLAVGEPAVSSDTFRAGDTLTVSVTVTNTGARAGSEVVQCYVAPESPRLVRPGKELKAFAKVHLEPGASTTVELQLDDRSFAYWDPGQADWEAVSARGLNLFPATSPERRSPGWQVDPGRFSIMIGRSSANICAVRSIEVSR